jgi:glutamate synthase domain-containing protein 3
VKQDIFEIDARGVYYRELNRTIRSLVRDGVTQVKLINVEGQRYIGTGLTARGVFIEIEGIPGEDLAAFMDGPTIIVRNNAQDGVGNTMNDGKVVVHGMAGDVVGYGMRGGRVYIRDDVGYRVGIHMKGYLEQQPIIVIGGKAGNFFGEYMAGGKLVLLGSVPDNRPVVGDYCATGMHGGTIYIRGEVENHRLGREVRRFPLEEDDVAALKPILLDFLKDTAIAEDVFDFDRYVKIVPVSARPYGRLYAY